MQICQYSFVFGISQVQIRVQRPANQFACFSSVPQGKRWDSISQPTNVCHIPLQKSTVGERSKSSHVVQCVKMSGDQMATFIWLYEYYYLYRSIKYSYQSSPVL